ncbi:Fc.00g079070.m01.CDS01 [Cosmosporella sp. VM-42]
MAEHPILEKAATLSSLPKVTATDLRSQVSQDLQNLANKVPILAVLDDDPTGTQTCHDVSILTVWDVPRLVSEFKRTKSGGGFFILTNSRAMHPQEAREIITEICRNLQTASEEAGTLFEVVLRSDSTLRGHFPLEAEAAEHVLGAADAWILCPFFLQGGRYTIGDVHYVLEDDNLVPAAQTPFAKDATFGYKSSNLRDYVVEKTKGTIPKERVTSISLETIRGEGVDAVLKQLLEEVNGNRPVIVINAAADEDVDVIVAALLKASKAGKRFLFRTGAAFVSARLGIPPIPPISASCLGLPSNVGGLVIAGSYVPKTAAQLDSLRTRSGEKLTSIVLDVRKLLKSEDDASNEVANALAVAEDEIKRGQDVLIMTSRKLIVGADEAKSLDIGSTVARVLVSFLQRLKQKPRYIIAKGGITSSDMATKALRMKRVLIVGQAAPGVPLWRCDEPESKWSGLPYVVFPGNVGTNDTLYEVVDGWRVERSSS